jgi:hypothetical protein
MAPVWGSRLQLDCTGIFATILAAMSAANNQSKRLKHFAHDPRVDLF